MDFNQIKSHSELKETTFIESLQNGSLPPNLFTHEAHLRLAFLYIKLHGSAAAEEKVSNMILNYVKHLGAEDKYHHTLTIAAVKIIASLIEGDKSFTSFLTKNPGLTKDFKKFIDQHYSNELLNDPLSKSKFIDPDREKF